MSLNADSSDDESPIISRSNLHADSSDDEPSVFPSTLHADSSDEEPSVPPSTLHADSLDEDGAAPGSSPRNRTLTNRKVGRVVDSSDEEDGGEKRDGDRAADSEPEDTSVTGSQR